MSDRRRNTARELDVGYTEEKIKHTQPSHSGEKIKYVKRRDEEPGTYARIMLGVALSVLMLYAVINSKVQVTAIKNEINKQQAEVQVLRNENNRMKTEIEKKSSTKTVESYAENVLGMQKLDKGQCEYIRLESGNVIEIPETEENFFVKLVSEIEEFWEYLRG